MTRAELLEALSQAGYTGPTSYIKSKLEELLRAQQGDAIPSASDTELDQLIDVLKKPPAPKKGAIVARPLDDDEIRLTSWMGLEAGDLIKVKGQNRATFTFVNYYKSPTQEYVNCRGGKKGHMKDRAFAPDLIMTMRNKPVMK